MHSDDALLLAPDDDDAVVIRPDAYDMASSPPLPFLYSRSATAARRISLESGRVALQLYILHV